MLLHGCWLLNVTSDTVTLDENHMLAGQNLTFTIRFAGFTKNNPFFSAEPVENTVHVLFCRLPCSRDTMPAEKMGPAGFEPATSAV